MVKIVVTDGFTLNPGDLDWSPLQELGECVFYDRTAPADMVDRCREADIILTNKAPVGSDVIAAAQSLRLICVTATGYNNVDTDAARARGIPVCNVPEYSTNAVAQHVLAMLLHYTNHIAVHAAAVQQGKWVSSPDFSFSLAPVTELAGKTMGIAGLGHIGTRVATLATAFGMQVIYSSRTPKQYPARQVSIEELFSESDVVTLHCPLTPQTDRFVNASLLALMKPTAVLINTGRGGLIDEPALSQALQSGRPAAALLDVLSTEPPAASNPLLGLSNCIITPHMAWAAVEARKRLLDTVVANIRAALAGRPQHVVN
ncbi:MAG: D-2-hydroxyacid dehydrogenase [Chitinophagaceae bacterium]